MDFEAEKKLIMYNFKNDYTEGAHPNILRRLLESNTEQHLGYGEDQYSIEAKALIKEKIDNPGARIYFASGGTQSNLMIIAATLQAHEAVISAQTGRIVAHETGAIEAVGHKVILVPGKDGKLCVEDNR